MQANKNQSEVNIGNQQIIDNKELNIWEALFPVLALVAMLAYNVFVFGEFELVSAKIFEKQFECFKESTT